VEGIWHRLSTELTTPDFPGQNLLNIGFVGPYSWAGSPGSPCVYEAEEARSFGIYLWTVPTSEGHLVYYVGETGRSFAVRMRQHFEELSAARYHIYSAFEFAIAHKIEVWPGRYDVLNPKSDDDCRAVCSQLRGPIQAMASMLRFFLAPISCDVRIRRRIESAIAQLLYRTPGKVGMFQDRGVRYHPIRNHEVPVACVASSLVPILGLPKRFSA